MDDLVEILFIELKRISSFVEEIVHEYPVTGGEGCLGITGFLIDEGLECDGYRDDDGKFGGNPGIGCKCLPASGCLHCLAEVADLPDHGFGTDLDRHLIKLCPECFVKGFAFPYEMGVGLGNRQKQGLLIVNR